MCMDQIFFIRGPVRIPCISSSRGSDPAIHVPESVWRWCRYFSVLLAPHIGSYDFVLFLRREVVLYVETGANLIRRFVVDLGSDSHALMEGMQVIVWVSCAKRLVGWAVQSP